MQTCQATDNEGTHCLKCGRGNWIFLGLRRPVFIFVGISLYFPPGLFSLSAYNINFQMAKRNNTDTMSDIGRGENKGISVEMLGFGNLDKEFFL
jgi:hypothetical protein